MSSPRPRRSSSRPRRFVRRRFQAQGNSPTEWWVPKLAVLGKPVAHSRSPAMHTAAARGHGPGGRVELQRSRGTTEDFEARVRAMAGRGTPARARCPTSSRPSPLADEASEAAPRNRGRGERNHRGGGSRPRTRTRRGSSRPSRVSKWQARPGRVWHQQVRAGCDLGAETRGGCLGLESHPRRRPNR